MLLVVSPLLSSHFGDTINYKVAIIKNLFDEPKNAKPTNRVFLPGWIGHSPEYFHILWSAGFDTLSTQYIIAAIVVMFFIGIKDDIVELTAKKKLYGQLVSAVIIVMFANIRVTSLYGVFGIYEIPYWFSVIFSIFTILTIINAFNLIDGIDGLAMVLVLLLPLLSVSGFITTIRFHSVFFLSPYSVHYSLPGFTISHNANIFMG
ncbi:MAG: undecaprenyl/decaprenyl-phosphate alpha-N-acetylglucosaminyl 1-phosphate transferase [Bacteroidetes bacterium]|nr:undecaprenyl/decaprenyl-phosphate alpha-N-acetylglucosaminyl 1-phosphate transferase [Bacteroidota bacterium]